MVKQIKTITHLVCLMALVVSLSAAFFSPFIVSAETVLDIGYDGNSSNYGYTAGYTRVSENNLCNGDGVLTELAIFGNVSIAQVKVGTFYPSSDEYHQMLTCRDSETIYNISAGWNYYTISLSVVAGDYLGYYDLPIPHGHVGGYITTSGDGQAFYAGDGCVIGRSREYGGLYMQDNYRINLYAWNASEPLGVSKPQPIMVSVGNITDRQAQLTGLVGWDGNWAEFCTASFGYSSVADESYIYVDGNETVGGDAATDEIYSLVIDNLVPGAVYHAYFVLENEEGEVFSEIIEFLAADTVANAAPEANTLGFTTSNIYINDDWSYGLKFNGQVRWDGRLDTMAGMQYRKQGTETWYFIETGDKVHTGDEFFFYRYGLERNSIYEYRAYVKNMLGTGYGDIEIADTSDIAFPTPTSGPGIEFPSWMDFPFSIPGWVKTILGILITVVGMILIVAVIRSTGGMLAAAAWGLGLTIVFVVIGWYSLWIILLIGSIVGLLTFLIILGGRK